MADTGSIHPFDVFLSHSTKDKDVVRPLAKRLRADGLKVWFDEWEIKPGDNIPAKIEEGLEKSRVLLLCMSANAFGSDWVQLEASTFRFRDPLNKERRFIPLRLDDVPIKDALAQFLYINWRPIEREQAYTRILEVCRPPDKPTVAQVDFPGDVVPEKAIQLNYECATVFAYAFSTDGKRVLTGAADNSLRVWDIETMACIRMLKSHKRPVRYIEWSDNQHRALICTDPDNVRLLDIINDRVVMDYGRQLITKRQMDCFRLLAGGLSSSDIQEWLDLFSLTVEEHLLHLKKRLGLDTRDDLRAWVSNFYGKSTKAKFPPLRVHPLWVPFLAWMIERQRALSGHGEHERQLRLCTRIGGAWLLPRTQRLSQFGSRNEASRVPAGPEPNPWASVWSSDQKKILYGSEDGVLRVWDATNGRLLRSFEGHKGPIASVALSANERLVLTGSSDCTLRLWDMESGRCIRVLSAHKHAVVKVQWSLEPWGAFSGDSAAQILIWDFSKFGRNASAVAAMGFDNVLEAALVEAPKQVQYTNAKVLLVGESGVGKTGLSNYLAHGIKVKDDNPLPSTDGAWATHWPVTHEKKKTGVDREIWLWDFAGQVDYRLVHQLFMDDTAAAVLVFNPQNENPFGGLGHWDLDLQKAARKPFAKLLAAARVDRGGLVVSAASMEKFMKERGFLGPLHATSAKTGAGCDGLREAVVQAIDWRSIPETTSPALYHRLKQEILSLRDGGLVLIRMAELKQRMEMTLLGENFDLAELAAVVGLLTGPGMIQRLDFGGFILLRPEVLSRYAAAVVRKVRRHPQELGCIREDDLLAGDLDYQDFKRLPREDETVVLRTLLETFVSRAWCLRQPCDGSAMLTFPSYFRRERKEQPSHPSVLVTYRFNGPADDIYATLVVRLHHTVAFQSAELWRSAADFKTQTGANLGFALTRETEGTSLLEVYFEPDVDENSRVLFLRYVHDHLMEQAQHVVRLRLYCCSNRKCKDFEKPFRDQEAIDEALSADGHGKVFCGKCGKPIMLRDVIEKRFESLAVKEQVREMQNKAQAVLDNESRELSLVGHAYSTVAEAGQIYRGFTNSDHGIDGEIEFKDDQGRASGKRLYVQLKSGDSYLAKRQSDGAEIFQIKNLRWADYWQQHAYPVMLVVRTSDGEIRWMDVSVYLKRKSTGGKTVKQIVFEGERFDVPNIRRLRKEVLSNLVS